MTRRLSMLAPALALAACLVLLPACGKKAPPPAPVTPSSEPGPTGGPSGGPSAAPSGFVVFAHLNGKDVVASELFAGITKGFGTGGGPTMLSELEGTAEKSLGVKPTDIASMSAFFTEIPPRGEPKFVGVMVATKAIDKAAVFKSLGITGTDPDARGLYAPSGAPIRLHFADDKTVALVSPDLADQYLAGFGKDRTGWPMSADLTTAAAGHALFARVNVEALRPMMKLGRDMDPYLPLLAAKSAELTLDLNGKTLALNVRGSYADAAAAGQAKEVATQGVGLAAGALLLAGDEAQLGAAAPALKEAKRAVKDVKIDVTGSDLTISTSYTANFDFAAMAAEAAKKVQGSAERMKAQNNLKQVIIALHSIHDAQGVLLVHGTGTKGMPLKKPTDKPLLSWRVAILPYIEQEQLYRQFKHDEAWDSDHNKKLIDKMPKIFAPPAGKTAKAGHTHLQMAVGPNAMQPNGVTITGITDGTSNTIAVAEAAEAVVWTKPDDIMLTGKDVPKDLKKKFGGLFPGGFNVAMWDGTVRFITDKVSERTLGALLSPAGGEVPGGDW